MTSMQDIIVILDEDIIALEQEAAQAGDDKQVGLCRAALDGNQAAWIACERAIIEGREHRKS